MADKVQKVVSWFLANKLMIKFDGESNHNMVDKDKVKVDGLTLKKGNTVDVIIEDNKVVSIVKVEQKTEAKAESKKEEPKQPETKSEDKKVEEPKQEVPIEEKPKDIVKQTLENVIVYAVSGNKEVIKVLSGETQSNWIHTSEDFRKKDYDKIGLSGGNEVTLILENEIIVDLKLIKTKGEDKKDKGQNSSKGSGYSEEDVYKRNASNNATAIIVAMINNGKIDNPESLKAKIPEFTQIVYDATKSLN